MVSAAEPPRPLISVFYTGAATFFQVAPRLSSQGLSGPRSRPTATQKIWWGLEKNQGPLGWQPGSVTTTPRRRSY
jgi:hypothetical protein